MKAVDLAAVLAAQGFIRADARPLPYGAGGRPWYISFVLGAAGWLASLSGFAFVLVLFSPDTAADFAVAGLVMFAAGFGLYAVDRESAFFEQLALALSLAGQIALIGAVAEATESATATAVFTAALSVGAVLVLPNHFARSLSAFFACIAWGLAVRFAWWGEDSVISSDMAVALAPAFVGWMVIWLPLALAAHVVVDREVWWMATPARRIIRPALTGLLLGLCLGTWTSEPLAALPLGVGPSSEDTNWLVLWPLLGVGAALFAGFCAFRVRHRAMIGVAIAGALLHVVHFYYVLGVSLVVKSYLMVGVGTLLLLAGRRLSREAPPADIGDGTPSVDLRTGEGQP